MFSWKFVSGPAYVAFLPVPAQLFVTLQYCRWWKAGRGLVTRLRPAGIYFVTIDTTVGSFVQEIWKTQGMIWTHFTTFVPGAFCLFDSYTLSMVYTHCCAKLCCYCKPVCVYSSASSALCSIPGSQLFTDWNIISKLGKTCIIVCHPQNPQVFLSVECL